MSTAHILSNGNMWSHTNQTTPQQNQNQNETEFTQINLQSLTSFDFGPTLMPQTEPSSLPTEKSGKRSAKKRKRGVDEDVSMGVPVKEDVSFVEISRDELLKISSVELEERVLILKKQRPFTEAEQREIQRQRKLVKNREYAITSRQKKKQVIKSLNEQYIDLKVENEQLKGQVTTLNHKVQLLEQENVHLKTMLAHSGIRVPQNTQSTQYFSQQQPLLTYGTTPMIMNNTYGYVNPSVPVGSYPQQAISINYANVPSPTSISSSPSSPMFHSPSNSTSHSMPGSPASSSDEVDNFVNSIQTQNSEDMNNVNDILFLSDQTNMDLPVSSNDSVELDFSSSKWEFPNMFTSGLCLLVVFFSFGLFISTPDGMNYPPGYKNAFLSSHFGSSTSRNLFEAHIFIGITT
eukprot:TRINITY_DN1254_c0_g2_i3.p1 TRINITY_DN1254_c0_g2~~TRINITY_DN1254_c0_g2_i3.p1  ORF type:complete len:405 (-),score=88.46 TRINITY_DN1254_c0_g2_i3:65-1279(-)